MHFFDYMKEIYLDSFEQFAEGVDAAREQMLQADYDLIKMASEKIDLDMAERLPNGCFDTVFHNIRFECFFHYKEGKPLYVILNGTRAAGYRGRPQFSRWSYYKFLNGSMLNIADPMLDLFQGLVLGWYYGTTKVNYRQIVAELVLRIATMYHIKESDIIFVGSSGGGAAAIECANYVKGSKVVAINPQLVLAEHVYAKRFTEITKNNLQNDKQGHRHNAIFYLQENQYTEFILIVNMRSIEDIKQLQNVCKEKGISVKYGLNIYDNLIIWIYDGNMGEYLPAHSTQEYYCIWFAIEFLVENIGDKEHLKRYEQLYRLIGEFWYEHWSQELKWKNRIWQIENVMNSVKQKEVSGIFGTGEKAVKLSKGLLDISGSNYFHIKYALDNDIEKRGGIFQGIPIKHPSDVVNWDEIYVIITSDLYDKEIKAQLEQFGLCYGKDFVSYKDLYN